MNDQAQRSRADRCRDRAMQACQDAGMTWALFSSLQVERAVYHVNYGDEVAVNILAHCEDCAIQALAENPPMHLEHLRANRRQKNDHSQKRMGRPARPDQASR